MFWCKLFLLRYLCSDSLQRVKSRWNKITRQHIVVHIRSQRVNKGCEIVVGHIYMHEIKKSFWEEYTFLRCEGTVFLSVVEYLLSLKVLVKPCLKRIVAALWCISPFAAFFLWSADCSCLFFSWYTIFFSRVCQKKKSSYDIHRASSSLTRARRQCEQYWAFFILDTSQPRYELSCNHQLWNPCYTFAVSLITLPQALCNYG
jgi:hypothetical protein